jgi:hypothetical protein
MSKSAKVWAKRTRLRLITELGGKCQECGEEEYEKLEFDHIYGKDWEATGLSTDQRMCRYVKEHKLGLLQCMCHLCNAKRGDPRGREMKEKIRLIFKLSNNNIYCSNGCTGVYIGDLDFVHVKRDWEPGDVHGDDKVALYAREMEAGRLLILCPECQGIDSAERQIIPASCAEVYDLQYAEADPF